MKIKLTIAEKVSSETPARYRKRVVQLENDSITIGTTDSADVCLKDLDKPFHFEIKFAEDQWWIVNADRIQDIKLNKKNISLESKLASSDEIQIRGHQILFEIDEQQASQAPEFLAQPSNDEEFFNYLLSEKEFDEIMINGADQIYVDWRGMLLKTPWKFSSNDFLQKKIESYTGKNSGWASWRLNRTLRMQAALPPIAEAPHLSIRKAKQNVLSLDQLLKTGFGSVDQIDFLKRALKEKQSIVISGGTSTGKTVLLRSLVEQIDPTERLVIVEEEAETDWPHPHAIAIESGRGQLRSAVVECLRMRPSRLIVSEVRGVEAFEMMQALNTGHSGSMTTLHSNSTREALSRLESLLLAAGVGVTVPSARRQIAQAVNIIVQLKRDTDGKRKISEIVRIGGIQNDTILLSDPIETEAAGIKQKLSLVE
ncbi:MAG: CpaF family protein [Deltaproteobacteria bacterium]|nr:CpaF family protein [Deltaproteobacteria bacterium]